MWDLKPMILARKQAGQPISPSLEEEFNNLPQSLQQDWDEAATFPSYHKIVERWVQDVFGDGGEDEEEETEEKVKEADDVPFEEPLIYKELKPYVPPITLSSQPEQEDVVTFPLKGEKVKKEETEEKAKEAEDVPFEEPLLYKELKPHVPPITFPSRLHKSNWNKWFFGLISSHFIVNIYLPLLIVCRNMPVREKFFEDLIAYMRKFETLEFG
ncbi:hypothetical protein QYF36_002585 [Acer negundo]|nr:hypothetical protein QYF36_002585 [Acer negundo]